MSKNVLWGVVTVLIIISTFSFIAYGVSTYNNVVEYHIDREIFNDVVSAKIPFIYDYVGVREHTEDSSYTFDDYEEGEVIATPTYTFDDYTVTVLAKIIYGEARGIKSYNEKAGIIWCILNRADNWNRSILSVALEPNQFYYYEEAHLYDDYGTDLKALVIDVLTQHELEKDMFPCNRILPKDYMWYWGDGEHNWFRNAFNGEFDVWEF